VYRGERSLRPDCPCGIPKPRQFAEFVRLKRKYNREGHFQSDWYRHYKAIFAEILWLSLLADGICSLQQLQ
jgi:hypothetical protein